MYIPPHCTESDPAEIARLIAAHPLACVVGHGPEGLVANHLPLLPEGEGAFVGHVARANRIHQVLAEGSAVLAIFRGEDAAVSPDWYPSKAETHRAVPTWNYQAVHVEGRIFWDDRLAFKRRVVSRLTTTTEGPDGWKMGDAPADYLQTMLDAIVGFRIEVTRVLAKTKLSQNRDRADFAAVRDAFAATGAEELAGRMDRMGR